MHSDRNAFKAGLFIVLSVFLIILVVVGIKGVSRLLEPHQTRVVYFRLTDDVGGLQVGDDVRIGGLKVGAVRALEIDQMPATGDKPLVAVTFNMPRRLVLKTGARVSVQGTLTGTSWLNIEDMGGGQPLAAVATLQGSPGSYAQVFSALGEVAPEVRELVRDVRGVTVPRVNETLASFKGTGERASEAMVQVRDLIGDTKTDLRGTAANLNVATGTIKQKLPGLLDKVDTVLATVKASVDSAYSALEDIKTTMVNAKELTGAARSIVMGNRGKLDGFVTNLKTASDNLKAATAEIRRSPWRLLYKPGKGEMANLNLYDAARQFAEGAGDVSDAAVSLRDALKDPRVDQATLQKLINRLDDSFGGFKKVEDDLWKQVKAE
ncbi:MAG TPA: MlaD family protein [Tepidisphaeraceae bacterium]